MIMDKRNISGDFSSWYKVSSYVKPKSPTQCDVRAKVFKLCCPQNIDHLLPVALNSFTFNFTLLPSPILIGYR